MGCYDRNHYLFQFKVISILTGALLVSNAVLAGDASWTMIVPGAEMKNVKVNEKNLTVLRFTDPKKFSWHVLQASPKSVAEWRKERKDFAVINAGYFTEKYRPAGYVRTADTSYGNRDRERYDGVFYIDQNSPQVCSTLDTAYRKKKTVLQEVQSFPLLITDGKNNSVSTKLSRRTVIAGTREGEIIIAVGGTNLFSWKEIAETLLKEVPAISYALNLDGGPSTGISLKHNTTEIDIPSAPVPNVIAIDLK